MTDTKFDLSPMVKDAIASMVLMGYARTSRKHGMVSRIDRPDWLQYMATKHSPWSPHDDGLGWISLLGERAAGDQYRRVYSKDTITLGSFVGLLFPASGEAPYNYYLPPLEGGDEAIRRVKKYAGLG